MPDAPATLFFGFRRPLNQAALKQALATCRPVRVGLVSRSNFLGPLTDEFLSARNGFRACTYRANPYAHFPGGHLLEQLLPNEVTALRMYERIFRGATTGQSYDKRRTLYREHVAWAYGLLREGNYQRLIFSEIPHHPFPYVLHSVASAMGLEVLFLAQLQAKETFVIAESIDGLFEPIQTAYRSLLRSAQEGAPALAPHLEAEFERRTAEHTPFYMGVSDLSWNKRLYQRSKKFFRGDDRLRFHRTIRHGLAYRRARRQAPHAGERFIYFPLHLQPEATTSPMGGVYVDQNLAIETLARALPAGWKVAVKENPAQRFAKRERGFYEHLASIPAVHLVSKGENTFDLIERCEAVATITGTAGWEALFRGKPTITFGRAFYRGGPGVISVDDPAELASQLRAIEDGTFENATHDDLRRFLRAIQSASHHGIVDPAYLRDSDLSFEDCVERYANTLSEIMAQECPRAAAAHGAPTR